MKTSLYHFPNTLNTEVQSNLPDDYCGKTLTTKKAFQELRKFLIFTETHSNDELDNDFFNQRIFAEQDDLEKKALRLTESLQIILNSHPQEIKDLCAQTLLLFFTYRPQKSNLAISKDLLHDARKVAEQMQALKNGDMALIGLYLIHAIDALAATDDNDEKLSAAGLTCLHTVNALHTNTGISQTDLNKCVKALACIQDPFLLTFTCAALLNVGENLIEAFASASAEEVDKKGLRKLVLTSIKLAEAESWKLADEITSWAKNSPLFSEAVISRSVFFFLPRLDVKEVLLFIDSSADEQAQMMIDLVDSLLAKPHKQTLENQAAMFSQNILLPIDIKCMTKEDYQICKAILLDLKEESLTTIKTAGLQTLYLSALHFNDGDDLSQWSLFLEKKDDAWTADFGEKIVTYMADRKKYTIPTALSVARSINDHPKAFSESENTRFLAHQLCCCLNLGLQKQELDQAFKLMQTYNVGDSAAWKALIRNLAWMKDPDPDNKIGRQLIRQLPAMDEEYVYECLLSVQAVAVRLNLIDEYIILCGNYKLSDTQLYEAISSFLITCLRHGDSLKDELKKSHHQRMFDVFPLIKEIAPNKEYEIISELALHYELRDIPLPFEIACNMMLKEAPTSPAKAAGRYASLENYQTLPLSNFQIQTLSNVYNHLVKLPAETFNRLKAIQLMLRQNTKASDIEASKLLADALFMYAPATNVINRDSMLAEIGNMKVRQHDAALAIHKILNDTRKARQAQPELADFLNQVLIDPKVNTALRFSDSQNTKNDFSVQMLLLDQLWLLPANEQANMLIEALYESMARSLLTSYTLKKSKQFKNLLKCSIHNRLFEKSSLNRLLKIFYIANLPKEDKKPTSSRNFDLFKVALHKGFYSEHQLTSDPEGIFVFYLIKGKLPVSFKRSEQNMPSDVYMKPFRLAQESADLFFNELSMVKAPPSQPDQWNHYRTRLKDLIDQVEKKALHKHRRRTNHSSGHRQEARQRIAKSFNIHT